MTLEIATKIERVRSLAHARGLHGILIRTRPLFAWLTGGGRNGINEATNMGSATLFITSSRTYLIASNIEARRLLEEEECHAVPMEVLEYPWHRNNAEAALIRQLSAGKGIGVDEGTDGTTIATELYALQAPLLPTEVERYKRLGKLTASELETACRDITPGMTEQAAAGLITRRFMACQARVPVCLVGSDSRLDCRRHPLPTVKPIERRFLAAVCMESGGLVCSASRLVSFVPLSNDTKARHGAVCEVDATALSMTLPGQKLQDIFREMVLEYRRQGFPDEWQFHHQGGSTGYRPRLVLADAKASQPVLAGQAYAWNPSITGTKSEDTILVLESGIEMITAPGRDWPGLEITRLGRSYRRSDILVMS